MQTLERNLERQNKFNELTMISIVQILFYVEFEQPYLSRSRDPFCHQVGIGPLALQLQ